MQNFKTTFTKAILAGLTVSIGGAIYLSSSSTLVGAIFFGFALFFILNFDYNLYTGKVGYIVENKFSYFGFLLIVLLGNLVGTVLGGILLKFAFQKEVLDYASSLALGKLDNNIVRVFINSFFCGILMFVGADFYKKKEDNFLRTVIVFLVVPIFILSKFEHSVANMFYFTVAGAWNANSIYYLIIMIIGNGVGAGVFCYLNNLANEKIT